MQKSLFLTLALGVASAFTLTLASPAYACGKDCPCAKKSAAKGTDAKPEAKPDAKPAEKPAAGEKKSELGAASAVRVAAGEEKKCECEAGGKGCTCKKGECKCANCGKTKVATFAQAEKKPACECPKKDCACAKGECKCHKKAEKGA